MKPVIEFDAVHSWQLVIQEKQVWFHIARDFQCLKAIRDDQGFIRRLLGKNRTRSRNSPTVLPAFVGGSGWIGVRYSEQLERGLCVAAVPILAGNSSGAHVKAAHYAITRERHVPMTSSQVSLASVPRVCTQRGV